MGTIDTNDLVECIYEAALIPERWQDVFDGLCKVSGSATSSIFVASPGEPPRGMVSRRVEEAFMRALANPDWGKTARAELTFGGELNSYVRICDVIDPESRKHDYLEGVLREIGLREQAGTVVQLPWGQSACLTLERAIDQGTHSDEELARLNALRPHLARSAVLSARMGLQQLQAAAAVLQAIGLPAAVLARDGRVLASNALLDASETVLPAAFGRVALATHNANALLQHALDAYRRKLHPPTSSIPVPATASGRSASVIHVLPLHGLGQDLFTQAAALLIEARFGASATLRDLSVLHGLFDLTPKEAQLAVALGDGVTLKEAAEQAGVSVSTVRSHLEQVFAKTGMHQQSQLVALLRSLPLVPTDPPAA